MSKFAKGIVLEVEIASAMTKASRALGVSATRYIEQAVARAVIADAERVALANSEASAEVARLAESANAPAQLYSDHSWGNSVSATPAGYRDSDQLVSLILPHRI